MFDKKRFFTVVKTVFFREPGFDFSSTMFFIKCRDRTGILNRPRSIASVNFGLKDKLDILFYEIFINIDKCQ